MVYFIRVFFIAMLKFGALLEEIKENREPADEIHQVVARFPKRQVTRIMRRPRTSICLPGFPWVHGSDRVVEGVVDLFISLFPVPNYSFSKEKSVMVG